MTVHSPYHAIPHISVITILNIPCTKAGCYTPSIAISLPAITIGECKEISGLWFDDVAQTEWYIKGYYAPCAV